MDCQGKITRVKVGFGFRPESEDGKMCCDRPEGDVREISIAKWSGCLLGDQARTPRDGVGILCSCVLAAIQEIVWRSLSSMPKSLRSSGNFLPISSPLKRYESNVIRKGCTNKSIGMSIACKSRTFRGWSRWSLLLSENTVLWKALLRVRKGENLLEKGAIPGCHKILSRGQVPHLEHPQEFEWEAER